MKTARSIRARAPKRPAATMASLGSLLVLAPAAAWAQTCVVNVVNYTPKGYVIGTYNGADTVCLFAYQLYALSPYAGT
jgi:hypothetical protein